MPGRGLSRAQRRAVTVLAAALEPFGFALAGGAALDAHGISDRPTDDLDSFSSSCRDFPSAFDRAIEALEGAGFDVGVDRRFETFCRLVISSRRTQFGVDLGSDSVMWGTEMTQLGPALSIRELAANKVLAAFGRNEPRDLYDLERLSSRVPLDQMLADAQTKDAGFDVTVLEAMVSRTLTKAAAEWPEGSDIPAIRLMCESLVAEGGAS